MDVADSEFIPRHAGHRILAEWADELVDASAYELAERVLEARGVLSLRSQHGNETASGRGSRDNLSRFPWFTCLHWLHTRTAPPEYRWPVDDSVGHLHPAGPE
jgi:hypothetical protein